MLREPHYNKGYSEVAIKVHLHIIDKNIKQVLLRVSV